MKTEEKTYKRFLDASEDYDSNHVLVYGGGAFGEVWAE